MHYLKILLFIVVVLVIGAAFLPQILSTNWAKEQILSQINKQIKGKITAESISLSWNGPQQINQAILTDLNGKQVICCVSVKLEGSLFQLWQERKPKHLYVEHLILNLVHMDALKSIFGENSPICALLCDRKLREKLQALLGTQIDLSFNAPLQTENGAIQLILNGTNGWLTLDAQLVRGVLLLTKPLKAEVKVTPQLAKTVLEDVLPILNGVIKADQPIKITVAPERFSMPLFPLQIDKIEMPFATLELGKMHFSNQGDLQTLFSLFNLSQEKLISIWFTPLYLQMKKGIVQLQRMDMLLMSRYHLALWGNVNTLKDKVDLKLGITAAAINQLIGTNLSKEQMLQISIKGKKGEAAIDKVNVMARASALLAQKEGSTPGMIIGALLDVASGSHKDTPPPPQTTSPLPWE